MPHDVANVAASAIELAANGTPPRRVKLLPIGRIDMRDGRGPYMIRDLAHARQIVAATQAWLGSADFNFDYDHQTAFAVKDGVGGAAIAAGWAKASSLTAEPDGIYAQAEWTAAAARKLSEREYRYISPLFMADKAGNVLQLKNAALVNIGAIDLPAIAASAAFGRQPAALTADEVAACEMTGVNHADFLAAKRQRESAEAAYRSYEKVAAASGGNGLTAAEVEVCGMLGIGQADFQRSKLVGSAVAATAGLRMGYTYENGERRMFTIEELKVLEAGEPADIQMALTPAEQQECQRLGWTYADYLKRKIRQLEQDAGAPIAAAALQSLTADEVAACEMTGVTPADFLREKQRRASAQEQWSR